MERRLNRACVLLMVIGAMERFVFKGVASNLVTYLTEVMKMSNSSAAKMVNAWCGLTSLLPLLVAPLADSYWDRYSTVLSFSLFYVVGLMALTSTALASVQHPPSKPDYSPFLFWSLCLISVGLGGYNPSLQAFATDQLDPEEELPCSKGDKKSGKNSLFFQWWYFAICSGSLLGITFMSYIQDTFGWVLGFAIPTGAMIVSVAFFSCGNRICGYKQDANNVGNKPFQIVLKSIRAIASKFKTGAISLTDEKSELVELELQEKPLCPQNVGVTENLEKNPKSSRIYAINNGEVVLRLLPIWTMLLMFAVIFQQPSTFFTKQGMVMKRNIGSHFDIPPATFQSAITLSIILLMPLYDKMLIPITRLFTRNEKGINVMQRMGIGMFFSITAMVIAALIETKRLEMTRGRSSSAELSIFWLLPQYILLGISDVFTVVGMQEFFYSEVPVRMRTMGFALYTSVFGVGSFLSALMITVIEYFTRGDSWFSDDMSKAHLDSYYWILAIASSLSLLLYITSCKFYRSPNGAEREDGI
ncbi:protein NRT1/ PTR FAMILY 5.9 [Rhodamnia argentea]|uniref:Protein NRT1/ PTR FAMILY 5.9 n=1 Tax=Rhodamnia argentea TaxID=178133 RepID=A0A8B8P8T6_9MYRT|nr:protein NRT1/ PTR FAMILY 5.9 [Rhodamnia argentea]